jgi:cell division protein FtsL
MTFEEARNKIVVMLSCLCVALAVGLGVVTHQLVEARATIDKQEAQLKELYGQVNELTLQYVEIVKRINRHGGQHEQ